MKTLVGVEDLELAIERARITVTALHGPVRTKSVMCIRRQVARELREKGYSYPEIGALLKRDHTTVMNLCKKDGYAK